MRTGDLATVLKTVKVFVDFIPDPLKTPVSALLDISISICERVEQVSENVQAVADLAEQQAGISTDVVKELHGLTEAQIDSGDWVRRLKKLTKALEKVREWVFKDSEDVKGDSKSANAVAKAVKAVAKLWNSQEKKEEIDALKAELEETREELKLQLGVATLVGVQRITDIARELTAAARKLIQSHDQALVARLKPVSGARYGTLGSPGGCLENTRQALRDDLRKSLTADDGRRIIWLYGLAGTGKSTVARSICSDLKDTRDVVSFFIKRDERSKQKEILLTLVYQLAQCIPQVFSAVVHAKDDLFDAHIHDQVEDLVRAPLSTVLPGARPVVIVLDAVDERDGTKNDCDIIPCFLDAIDTAKAPVHVLITSRGHPSDFLRPTHDSEAVHATQGLPRSVVKEVSMHDKSYDPESDIRAYLAAELQRVALKRRVSNWPPATDQIDDLVRMSAGLFIFAATVIRWIDGSAPVYALSQLLKQSSALMETKGSDTIFALYEYVITHALDENTPQQLLRSALGKNPDDGTEVDALCREATLSILSTLLCVRKPERSTTHDPAFREREGLGPREVISEPEPHARPLTRNAFVRLWAGHLIVEPELHEGIAAVAARLSGVLFVWEPGSSMTLLHASFGDFLATPSLRYHVSSEATHFDLASKCVSIMLTTKDAYVRFHSTSSVDALLNHRLNVIPWILDSDLAAQYAFAHWIFHACSAPHIERARLLEQVRLAERRFWFAGVFLHSTFIGFESLQQAFDTTRDAEAAYSLATAVYMCADETSDFMLHNPRSLRISSFQRMCDALSILLRHEGAGTALSDDHIAMAEHRVDSLDQLLRNVLAVLDLWMVIRRYRDLSAYYRYLERGDYHTRGVTLHNLTSTLILDLGIPRNIEPNDRTGTMNSLWPSNFSTRIYHLAAVLYDLQQHMECWIQEMASFKDPLLRVEQKKLESIAQELEKWAEEFRYALRESKHQIVKPYDEQVIAALRVDRRNAGPTNESTHGGDGRLDSTLSSGHSLGVAAPARSEGQSLEVGEVLPAELHSGSVDPSPSEGQSLLVDELHLPEGQLSQVIIPLPHEERATVKTSAASTVGFFAVLVFLYALFSSLFA